MQSDGGSGSTRSRSVSDPLWLAGGAALVAVTAGAVLSGSRWTSGPAAAAAGAAILLARRRAGRRAASEALMESSFLDRAFDGGVLGTIAWVSRHAEPIAAVGALAALSLSFLAAYVRARGAALGYGVGESGLSAGLRYGLVAAGLWLDALSWTIWVAAAISALSLLVRASQVVKEERV